jgi:hypothetical protein
MGLMQIMPETYAELRLRHHLGADPYAPRNNIWAGAPYLREMRDLYGRGGFLAAYNASPGRYETIWTAAGRFRKRPAPMSPAIAPKIDVLGNSTSFGGRFSGVPNGDFRFPARGPGASQSAWQEPVHDGNFAVRRPPKRTKSEPFSPSSNRCSNQLPPLQKPSI